MTDRCGEDGCGVQETINIELTLGFSEHEWNLGCVNELSTETCSFAVLIWFDFFCVVVLMLVTYKMFACLRLNIGKEYVSTLYIISLLGALQLI